MPGPNPLTSAVAQPLTIPYDVVANAAADAAIVVDAKADVVVFPELSLTDYRFDADAVVANDERLSPLIGACRKAGTVALAGAPIDDEGGNRFIAVVRVDGHGAVPVYRKMFLGTHEADHFSVGPAPMVIDVAGWRIGLAVCKDTGVIEHAIGRPSSHLCQSYGSRRIGPARM